LDSEKYLEYQKLQLTIQREIERQKEIEEKVIAEEKKKAEIEMQKSSRQREKSIQEEDRQKLQNETKEKEVEVKSNSSEIPQSPTTEESSINAIDTDTFIITAMFKISVEKDKVDVNFVKNKVYQNPLGQRI